MANGISGNCGLANARVVYFDTTTFVGNSVIADSSGNYNTGAILPNGTYEIQPTAFGYKFTPFSAIRTIVGANISGVNFTSALIAPTTLSFTQLTQDTFQRANENPLNPAVWDSWFGVDHAQIVSNECVLNLWPTNTQGDCNLTNNAIDWSTAPDQWVEVKLQHLSSLSSVTMYLRTNPAVNHNTTPCYRFSLAGPFNDAAVTSGWFADVLLSNATIPYSWVSRLDYQLQTFQLGDVVRFGVVGGAKGFIYTTLNGQLMFVGSIADSIAAGAPLLTSGVPGLQLLSSNAGPTQQLTDVGIINFKAGSALGVSGTTAGEVTSCAPVRGADNTWEVVYTYPLDVGGRGQALVFVGPNRDVKQWLSLTDVVTVPLSPGSTNQITLTIPDIVKWATFGVGNFGGTRNFPYAFFFGR